jgi:hypothetical protein
MGDGDEGRGAAVAGRQALLDVNGLQPTLGEGALHHRDVRAAVIRTVATSAEELGFC